MFCFQCEQTEGAKGCRTIGVCGKTPEVAHLQDATVHALKALSAVAHAARNAGMKGDPEVDRTLLHVMFATLTNVNFDADYFVREIPRVLALRDGLLAKYRAHCAATGRKPEAIPLVDWAPASNSQADLEAAGIAVGVIERRAVIGEEASGLSELITYGLKGACAYACHALEAGREADEVYARLHKSMAVLASNETDLGKLVGEAMYVGETSVKVLATLDAAHSDRFGAPTPTPVNHSPVAGKCILISGHDLVDLEALLKQTEGTGINVYTHGEMLPAHGYPGLKKYKHLVGNYGGAWQLQRMEYGAFPGPIIQSTNCIMEPRTTYKSRIFTTNSTGWPGVTHIEGRDFSKVIETAKAMPGFKETKPPKNILTGFGHSSVLSVAPAVLDAAKKGVLERIVLIGGCDGSEIDRSYYTRLATNLPQSAAILTLGCAKYRILGKKDYGTVGGVEGGIPRVLDMGQCNDSYSAVVVAQALAKALGTDVNSLPLSIVLSWLEQKAAAVLLACLHLGIKNIRIGPELPAFVTPKTLAFLQANFGLQHINMSHPDGDVASVMGRVAVPSGGMSATMPAAAAAATAAPAAPPAAAPAPKATAAGGASAAAAAAAATKVKAPAEPVGVLGRMKSWLGF